MSLAMTKQEREAPLTVPVWYAYDPGGELRVVTARTSRKDAPRAMAQRGLREGIAQDEARAHSSSHSR